jgi:hypothetical protein
MSTAEEFIHLFVAQPQWLIHFLEHVVQHPSAKLSRTIYNTLLEMYLDQNVS